MRSPGGSREYAVADERGGVVKKETADALIGARFLPLWGDYVSRWSFVEDVTGDLAVIIESATHDEVVVSSISDLDTYMVYDPETLDIFIKKLKKARRRILKRA